MPEIEKYIGHKIPVASYNPDDLPEIIRPKPRPRKPRGGPRGRSGGGGKPHSGSRRRPPRKS